MDKTEELHQQSELLSLKTVIRTKDFEVSRSFYTQILDLTIVEEYDDGNGSRGCIVRLGQEGSNALFEISEIDESHDYYQEPFSRKMDNDKMDIQIRTDNIEYWASRLNEKWEARGPVLRPWGSLYLYLRDPDGLQIIICQGK